MKHGPFIGLLILTIIILILYKLSTLKIETVNNTIMFYIILLEIVLVASDHLYNLDLGFNFSTCNDADIN